jgi:hypothetical protein
VRLALFFLIQTVTVILRLFSVEKGEILSGFGDCVKLTQRWVNSTRFDFWPLVKRWSYSLKESKNLVKGLCTLVYKVHNRKTRAWQNEIKVRGHSSQNKMLSTKDRRPFNRILSLGHPVCIRPLVFDNRCPYWKGHINQTSWYNDDTVALHRLNALASWSAILLYKPKKLVDGFGEAPGRWAKHSYGCVVPYEHGILDM